jgi:outer membrane protein OmpA-like peptidoglycan-associated protein
MASRGGVAPVGIALAICVLLTGHPSDSGAQTIEKGLLLGGFFSETSYGLARLPEDGGTWHSGGALTLGLELVGLPAREWQFDLAGRYQANDAEADGGFASWDAELRAGYSLGGGRLIDFVPLASLAIASPLGSFAPAASLGAALKVNLYLGSWSYASLIPQCSYPLKGGAPSISIGLGFKQLLAWSDKRSVYRSRLPPSAEEGDLEPVPEEAQGPLRTGFEGFSHLSLIVDPLLFSPDDDGADDSLSISLKIDSPGSVRSWELSIEDERQHRFFARSGLGAPPATLKWDGKSDEGQLVESASEYSVRFSAKDGAGRELQATKSFSTDVLVLRDGDRYKIRIPNFVFPADSAEFSRGSEASFARQNSIVLERLAGILRRFPSYRITIEGHANLVNWSDPVLASEEERNTLLPLSLERAQAVKDALTRIGVEAERMQVSGLGGREPVAPFDDAVNNWKNRRVEILLNRQ